MRAAASDLFDESRDQEPEMSQSCVFKHVRDLGDPAAGTGSIFTQKG
ncbi:MAG: hypothetical protein ACI9OJ_005739, partial [Myxococcota bacterium]